MTLYGVTALDSGTGEAVRYLIETADPARAVEAVCDQTGHTPAMWEQLTRETVTDWRRNV